MRKIFKYCDEHLDMGEIGEHEMEITALNVAIPGEEPRLLIQRAIVTVRFPSYPAQTLDVTSVIKDDFEWALKVEKSYRDLENRFDEEAI